MSDRVAVKHVFTARVPAGALLIEATKHGELRLNLTDADVRVETTFDDGSQGMTVLAKVDVFAHTFEAPANGP